MKKLIKNYLYAGLIALMTASFVACQQSTSDSTLNNNSTNYPYEYNQPEEEAKSNFPFGYYRYYQADNNNTETVIQFKEDGTTHMFEYYWDNQTKCIGAQADNIFTFELVDDKLILHSTDRNDKTDRTAQWSIVDDKLQLKETDDIEYNNSLNGVLYTRVDPNINSDRYKGNGYDFTDYSERKVCGLNKYFSIYSPKYYQYYLYITKNNTSHYIFLSYNLNEDEHIQQELNKNILKYCLSEDYNAEYFYWDENDENANENGRVEGEGWYLEPHDSIHEEKISQNFDKATRTLTLYKTTKPTDNYNTNDDDNGGGNSGNESGSISASDFEDIEWKFSVNTGYSTAVTKAKFNNGSITVNPASGATRTASYSLSGNKMTINYSSYDATEFTISVSGDSLTLDGGNSTEALQILMTLFSNTSGTGKMTFTK